MQKILYLLFIAVIAFHSGDGMVSKETIDGPGGYEALFTHGNLHEIEIIITKEEWNGLIQDMKDYAEDDWNGLMRTGNYRKADLIYKGPAGDTIIEDVGFRTKGNVSRVIPQDDNGNFHRSHFKVKFDKTFDIQKGTDEYEERKERRFCELKSLNLRWHMSGSPKMGMGIDEDTSQIRELYCYDLLNKAGIYTSKTGSARLAINIDGEKHYFGIYTIMEPVDKLFLTKRFGTKKNDGNLYKCLLGDSGPASLEPTGDHVNFFFREERIIGVEDWESHYRPTYDLKTNEDE
ncbi:MAG: CotH kinase family protein, partial [Thermodesulfobacteriota bacterium]|nr:CotH kinase family protein [Thermodesulfobacteriota bacterium]